VTATPATPQPGLAIDFDAPDPLTEVVRYSRLENLPAILAFPNAQALGAPMTAQLLGCDIQRLLHIRSELRAAIDQACDRLLSETHFAPAIHALPFAPGDTVVAVGDSITADELSWAEILAAALTRLRPGEIQLINAGVSGDTTADLIARFNTIAGHRPDWIITMIGTNDARRHGPGGAARMASPSETRRNLQAFEGLVKQHTKARLTYITPSPVDQTRVVHYDRFRADSTTWREIEVRQVAKIIRQQTPLVVDIYDMFYRANPSTYLTADGVHPSLAGQRQIANAVVAALAASAAR
jgi:lysophospholipase L1-like esterase